MSGEKLYIFRCSVCGEQLDRQKECIGGRGGWSVNPTHSPVSVEKVEVVRLDAPNVLTPMEALHASQNLAVRAPGYHKEVRPEIEALTKRLATFVESQEVADA